MYREGHKKCSGSIKIADTDVVRNTGHSGHTCLSGYQVKILINGQELKKMVEFQVSQTVLELYRAEQAELKAANVPANVIAAEFSSFRSQLSSLHRRRAKN